MQKAAIRRNNKKKKKKSNNNNASIYCCAVKSQAPHRDQSNIFHFFFIDYRLSHTRENKMRFFYTSSLFSIR